MSRPTVPTDPAKLREAALDVFVYAPIGFLFDAREVVPKLVERGKGQVALARLFGRYALQRGQVEADKLINARRPAPSTATGPASPAATQVVDESPARAAPATNAAKASAKSAPKAKARPAGTQDRAVALAIPGYDTLSASQVVPRLDALRPAELEAVRAYEAAHRGRRTILNRIAQLQA